MTTFWIAIFLCAAITGLIHYGTRSHRYAWFMVGAFVPMIIIAALVHLEVIGASR